MKSLKSVFTSSKKQNKHRAASERHFEKYGKLVAYDPYTGDFRDFKSLALVPPSTKVIKHAKRCNCECIYELTLQNLGHFENSDNEILKQRIEDVGHHEMLHYLTANHMQHRSLWTREPLIEKLEVLYSKNPQLCAGHYKFDETSQFDDLLRKMIQRGCFRRLVAFTAKGYTLFRVMELCLDNKFTDVDYAHMMYQIIKTSWHMETPDSTQLATALAKFPNFYINSVHLGVISRVVFTLSDTNLLFDDACLLFYIRVARIALPWKCKRLLLAAVLKPQKKCNLSVIPLDILKIIIRYSETIRLPDSRKMTMYESFNEMK
jgi:hypothetical protein